MSRKSPEGGLGGAKKAQEDKGVEISKSLQAERMDPLLQRAEAMQDELHTLFAQWKPESDSGVYLKNNLGRHMEGFSAVLEISDTLNRQQNRDALIARNNERVEEDFEALNTPELLLSKSLISSLAKQYDIASVIGTGISFMGMNTLLATGHKDRPRWKLLPNGLYLFISNRGEKGPISSNGFEVAPLTRIVRLLDFIKQEEQRKIDDILKILADCEVTIEGK